MARRRPKRNDANGSDGEGWYRFPCGHTEAHASVVARLRGAEAALWVACRECSLIALAVAPPRTRRRRRVPA